jgi:DNA gyrase/topoisomerase IV subunit A
MAPHNVGEVVAATCHLIDNPNSTLKALMKHLPGPDFPTGGKIVDTDGIIEAYETGKGAFKVQATAFVDKVSARKQGIVITELPFNVGPEKVVEKIADLVKAKKIQGISDIIDLSDGKNGTKIVVEAKTGYDPEEILTNLYRLTPMEESFSINAVALVNGQPKTLPLKELLQVYIDHRISVVTRRSKFRREKAKDRLHIVEGLLKAIIDIDKVIKLIRASDDTEAARKGLMSTFKLSEIQANYILEMPLRRLTKFSKLELDTEEKELKKTIAELTALLKDEGKIRAQVSLELKEEGKRFATPRRTFLFNSK